MELAGSLAPSDPPVSLGVTEADATENPKDGVSSVCACWWGAPGRETNTGKGLEKVSHSSPGG